MDEENGEGRTAAKAVAKMAYEVLSPHFLADMTHVDITLCLGSKTRRTKRHRSEGKRGREDDK